MPQQTKDYLKEKFQTGDIPTQQDFYDWLDSFWHKSETLPGGGGSSSDPVNIAFNTAVPFDKICSRMAPVTLSAPTNFTVNTTNAKASFGTIARVETGGNAVTFTGFRRLKGSQTLSHTEVNIIVFTYDGTEYSYTILQYEPEMNFASFVWQTLGGSTTKTGNAYTMTTAAGGSATNPNKKLSSSAQGAFIWEASEIISIGLHNNGTDAANMYVYGYYSCEFGEGSGAITLRQNQVTVTSVARPTGTTHYGLFIDAFAAVTLRYSTDGGTTFTVLYSFSTPATTAGSFLFAFLNGAYNDHTTTLSNPQYQNGVPA